MATESYVGFDLLDSDRSSLLFLSEGARGGIDANVPLGQVFEGAEMMKTVTFDAGIR